MSEVRVLRNRADVDPQKGQGCFISQGNHGDPDVLRSNACMTTPHHIAAQPNFRITEDDFFRITESGDFRILETAA